MNAEAREARARRRFWRRVEPRPDGCWIWTGGKDADGYGAFYYNGRNQRAHRVSFQWHHGRPVESEILRHSCDFPACVRPDHLLEGSQQQNIDDAYARGRKNDAGSANGFAKLTEAQVVEIRSLYGRRGRGGFTQTQIAANYGIHQTHVSDIINRVVWKHV